MTLLAARHDAVRLALSRRSSRRALDRTAAGRQAEDAGVRAARRPRGTARRTVEDGDGRKLALLSATSSGWAPPASAARSRSPGSCSGTWSRSGGWISRQDYLDGLALAQLAPGPLAAQLAMYLGYVRAACSAPRSSGCLFVLPSFLMVWALSVAYVRFGGLPWMQALFYGIGAAVIGIIARSAHKLTQADAGTQPAALGHLRRHGGRRRRGPSARSRGCFCSRACSRPALGAGDARRRRASGSPVGGSLCSPGLAGGRGPLAPTLTNIFWVFAKAGAFVFGSGLAIVPFLYGELVQTQGWLNDRQFLDAVAVAMITPGPVVITVAFIGYLVGGPWGMTVAALGVFLPVYLFVVLPAPYFRRHRSQPLVKAFVEGVSAAATGAIAGAAYVLVTRAVVDVLDRGHGAGNVRRASAVEGIGAVADRIQRRSRSCDSCLVKPAPLRPWQHADAATRSAR